MHFNKFIIAILLLASFSTATINAQTTDSCASVGLPSITIRKGSVFLGPAGKILLDTVAVHIKANSNCRVKVMGYYKGVSPASQQASWDKVFSVIDYLSKKGISKERFIFYYGDTGDIQLVDLMFTTEDGPSTVPAPMACLSYHKLTKRRCKEPVN